MNVLNFIDFQCYPIKQIFKNLFQIFFFMLYSISANTMSQVPEIIKECFSLIKQLLSFKGLMILSSFAAMKFGFSPETITGLAGTLGVGGYKIIQDYSKYKVQNIKTEQKKQGLGD